MSDPRIPFWISNEEDVGFPMYLPVQCINYLFQKEYDAHPELYDPYPSSYYRLVDDHPDIKRPIPRDMQFNIQVGPIDNLIDITNVGTPEDIGG
uniref:Uncharacterized protein n=1 Tax=viral metagenome TaxID=1070528 RepID=A0A6C0JR24_9ZZZZ